MNQQPYTWKCFEFDSGKWRGLPTALQMLVSLCIFSFRKCFLSCYTPLAWSSSFTCGKVSQPRPPIRPAVPMCANLCVFFMPVPNCLLSLKWDTVKLKNTRSQADNKYIIAKGILTTANSPQLPLVFKGGRLFGDNSAVGINMF